MKKIAVVLLMLCFAISAFALSDEKNLYLTYKDYKDVKIYLEDVTDSVKNPDVSIKEFTVMFAKVLSERMEKKFYFVDKASDADVVIKANIADYKYDEKAMPSVLSAAALAADVLTPKSSAKLIVDYTIIQPSTGKVLLNYKRFTTVERPPAKDITAQKAFGYAAEKNINRFLYRAFYKQKKKPLVN